ncbi:MAG: serine--tRNA ligase [Planctomycetota bacterium]|nr:serine--tRNA ligase [Planctomycetota bacterium]
MLDRKFITENADAVALNCQRRGAQVDVHHMVELELRRREMLKEVEQLNRRANEVSKSIGSAADESEREARKDEGRQLREQKDNRQAEHDQLDEQIGSLQAAIPNMSHPDAPVGEDDKANLEIRRGNHSPPEFDFPVLDHVELAEKHDLIDFEAGARIAGSGFYFLKNEAVLLELALQQFAVSELVKHDFQPVITPDLAASEILHGTGYIPRGPETQIYSVENTNLNLVATAEITLGGMLAGEVVESTRLPLKMVGISHCFRTEAGAAGRATRGLFRVHQFTKIEMFAFTLPNQSEEMLEHFCQLECDLFDQLGIPYRVVDTATGDLGGPAYRKYDLEAWMPGRGDGGEWGEVTSTSNCTDYQARRLNARYRTEGEKGTRLLHTLNGTAIAISRCLIAILENYQQADGSILVPEVLRPWVGKDQVG